MPAMQHIVLLKFKAGTPQATIGNIFQQLGELKSLIPGMNTFCAGAYSSHEGRNKGFTHGFIMEFKDAQARDVYLPHPEHERVKKVILAHVDDVLAFDFES